MSCAFGKRGQTAITQKSTVLTRKVVTKELRESFRRELSSLGFRHIEVELEEAGGAEGGSVPQAGPYTRPGRRTSKSRQRRGTAMSRYRVVLRRAEHG